MKKLTKKERHEVYKMAKNNLGIKISGLEIDCMCWAIMSVIEPRFFTDLDSFTKVSNYSGSHFEGLGINHDTCVSDGVSMLFPEFESIKPESAHRFGLNYWFETREERLEAFDKLIEMTK